MFGPSFKVTVYPSCPRDRQESSFVGRSGNLKSVYMGRLKTSVYSLVVRVVVDRRHQPLAKENRRPAVSGETDMLKGREREREKK